MEPSLLAVLKQSALFSGQSPAALVELVGQLEVVTLSAGRALFAQGDAADAAYLLTLGTVKIVAADGTLLDTEGPGALIGEQALMPGGGKVRGAGVVADSEPRLEWKETINKARAIFRAAHLAESGFTVVDGMENPALLNSASPSPSWHDDNDRAVAPGL